MDKRSSIQNSWCLIPVLHSGRKASLNAWACPSGLPLMAYLVSIRELNDAEEYLSAPSRGPREVFSPLPPPPLPLKLGGAENFPLIAAFSPALPLLCLPHRQSAQKVNEASPALKPPLSSCKSTQLPLIIKNLAQIPRLISSPLQCNLWLSSHKVSTSLSTQDLGNQVCFVQVRSHTPFSRCEWSPTMYGGAVLSNRDLPLNGSQKCYDVIIRNSITWLRRRFVIVTWYNVTMTHSNLVIELEKLTLESSHTIGAAPGYENR